jgi:hypothetical protein
MVIERKWSWDTILALILLLVACVTGFTVLKVNDETQARSIEKLEQTYVPRPEHDKDVDMIRERLKKLEQIHEDEANLLRRRGQWRQK